MHIDLLHETIQFRENFFEVAILIFGLEHLVAEPDPFVRQIIVENMIRTLLLSTNTLLNRAEFTERIFEVVLDAKLEGFLYLTHFNLVEIRQLYSHSLAVG